MQRNIIETFKVMLNMLSLAGKPFQNVSRNHVDYFAVLELHHFIRESLPVGLVIL